MILQNRCKYISAGQTAVLITAFALLYCVFGGTYSDCGDMLANIVSSSLAAAVLSIPLAAVTSRSEGSVIDMISEKIGERAAAMAGLLYLIYFTAAAAHILGGYSVFAAERYFEGVKPYVCIILAGLVCIYISWTGIETVCRMSTMILGMILLTAAAFIIFAANDFSVPRITLRPIVPADVNSSGIFPYLAAAAAAMCIVCGGTANRTRKGVYMGIAASLAAAAAVTAAVFSVLGDFSVLSDHPAADAVIYASREMSFRPDGLFFSLTVILALAAVSLLCACAAKALKAVFPKLRGEGIYTSAAAVGIAVICSLTESPVCSEIFGMYAIPVILLGVLPLTVMAADVRIPGKGTVKQS